MKSLILLCLLGVITAGDTYAGYSGTWVVVRATAYSPHDEVDGHHWSSKDTITATGRDWRTHPYGIAVARNEQGVPWVPYGTKIIVPRGFGYLDNSKPDVKDRVFQVDDTGGALRTKSRKWNMTVIDLRYMDSPDAAKFGGLLGYKDIMVFVIQP